MATESINNQSKFDVAALNEALMLGLVRQHEMTEAAEMLNAQLKAEMLARKRAEDALIGSARLASVGRMAAVLAHEINNPLEAITNVLFLAQNTEGMPETARQYLALADAELRRIAHIARQTLGFYREQSAPTTFHLASLLDSVCDLLQAKVVSRRAVIETQCDRNLEMTAFEGEMRQVLSNLLLNSLEAIGEGGKVVLRGTSCTRVLDGSPAIRLTVADNGEGIKDCELCQIFDPFFTTKGSVGNGLGLWVSKQIIEKHGGTIQVRSQVNAPLQGTTFSLVLPVHGYDIEARRWEHPGRPINR